MPLMSVGPASALLHRSGVTSDRRSLRVGPKGDQEVSVQSRDLGQDAAIVQGLLLWLVLLLATLGIVAQVAFP